MEISQVFGKALACSFSKRFLKRRFLAGGLTEIFIVCNFRNTLAVTSMFFSKCLKCDVDSRNGTKNGENVFSLSDNCIWIGSCKFSQPRTGYLPSADNVLINAPGISPNTRADIFQITFPQNDGKTGLESSHANLASIYDAFTCWLPKSVLKRCSWESFLTKLFTVYNFRNALAMTIIRMFKIWFRMQKWNKKSKKRLPIFR